jgi:hypothetical protein
MTRAWDTSSVVAEFPVDQPIGRQHRVLELAPGPASHGRTRAGTAPAEVTPAEVTPAEVTRSSHPQLGKYLPDVSFHRSSSGESARRLPGPSLMS